MMTSSNGNIFRVTGHLCGESPVPGEFPAQKPVTRSFHAFLDLRLNKPLSKQSWGWRFETLSHPSCRHCDDKTAGYLIVYVELHEEVISQTHQLVNRRTSDKTKCMHGFHRKNDIEHCKRNIHNELLMNKDINGACIYHYSSCDDLSAVIKSIRQGDLSMATVIVCIWATFYRKRLHTLIRPA